MRFGIILVGLVIVSKVAAGGDAAKPAFASTPAEKDGLQVTMLGDKTVFARNEPIKFTVRFKNVSDKPLSLQDADDFRHWVIRLQEVSSKMPWRLQGIASDQPEPAHQPGELRPGENVDVSTDWGSKPFPFRYESELILNLPIPPVDSLRPGGYQLWLGINLKKNPEYASAHMAFQGDINVGPVEIEISDKDDPTGLQASEAVKENNAEFQTVARPKWLIPAIGARSDVQIGLKATNRTGKWMQVNVFDTVQVVLEDPHGTQLQCVRERDATSIPEPLVLEPRESRTIFRNATLEWSQDGKFLRLIGPDGAGGNWHFDDLKASKYTVHFVYENNEERLKPALNRTPRHFIDPKEAPFLMGKLTTKDLAVEAVAATK